MSIMTPRRTLFRRLAAAILALALVGAPVAPPADAAPKKRPAVTKIKKTAKAKARKRTPKRSRAARPRVIQAAATVALPRPRPDAAATAEPAAAPAVNAAPPPAPVQTFAAGAPFGFPEGGALTLALDAVTKGDYAGATWLVANGPALDQQIVRWLVARAPDSGMTPDDILAVRDASPGWPAADLLTLRAEGAFLRSGPAPAEALAWFTRNPPVTVWGKLALARALAASGRSREAGRLVAALWRGARLTGAEAARLLASHGALLTRADHEARLRFLLGEGRLKEARAQAALAGGGAPDLVAAVIAAYAGEKNAPALLAKAAPRFAAWPEFRLAEIAAAFEAKRTREAASMLLATPVPMELAGASSRWLEARHDLTRALLDLGEAELAYRVAARPVGEEKRLGERSRARAAFDAGWYALRFLGDPKRALPHLDEMAVAAPDPRLQARANYWRGRAHTAAGDALAASLSYKLASAHGHLYYGQLSREALGEETTGLERVPRPSLRERLAFAEWIEVKVIKRLAAAEHAERVEPFFDQLAETVATPGEIALTIALARRIERPRLALGILVKATARGLDPAGLSAPLIGIPHDADIPESLERAVVFAVARQESSFNSKAKSPAGARGLMQLMPGTAREMAAATGRAYAPAALTDDPRYNVALGSAYVRRVLNSLGGSWIMTFAGYNAGPSRAKAWARAYGDPRSTTEEAIDWVERIPFEETRNYVERVMEHMIAYRSRLGHKPTLSQDLSRGEPAT